MTEPAVNAPAWLADIASTVAVTRQYVLWGNVQDIHVLHRPDGVVMLLDTRQALWSVLAARGYEALLCYDPVDGIRVLPDTPEAHGRVQEACAPLSLAFTPREATPISTESLAALIRLVAGTTVARLGLMVSRPSRLTADVSRPDPAVLALFAAGERAATESGPHAVDGDPGVRPNPIVWLIDRQSDLPAWLVADNEADVRTVVVAPPDREARAIVADMAVAAWRADGAPAAAVDEAVSDLADRGDGLGLREILAVVDLARDQGIGPDDVESALRAYRVGATDNPWRKDYLRDRVVSADGPAGIRARVMGQDAAVTKALDILKRSVLGLSGAQARSSGSRPRGVLLLVGPTGTGKTELAKALTEVVFGEGAVPLRFDMSEFGADHSEARLMGAPPGYVGYDAGGELTNAIRRQPFSLVLFDEIDKAHPRILDKFLQILDEGRLTDGRGATVSFQESLLVFTSNAGMKEVNQAVMAGGGGLDALPTFEELRGTLERAIDEHFTRTLQRPELLNRFGENIVVFDFIRPPVTRAIFDSLVAQVVARVAGELDVTLTLGEEPLASLADSCVANPLMGGRGIANLVESLLVNPLGRALFALDPAPGSAAHVVSWAVRDGVATVELAGG